MTGCPLQKTKPLLDCFINKLQGAFRMIATVFPLGRPHCLTFVVSPPSPHRSAAGDLGDLTTIPTLHNPAVSTAFGSVYDAAHCAQVKITKSRKTHRTSAGQVQPQVASVQPSPVSPESQAKRRSHPFFVRMQLL